jgi:hypothetical protein
VLNAIRTQDIDVGSRIDLPGRGVIVADNMPDGLRVIWFDDMMRGPYSAVLPHCTLYRRTYHDERNGEHQSFYDVHPDFTGKTGEI